MKEALKYGAVLIGIYLVAFYGTNTGQLVTSGSAGATNVIKAFQGR